MKDGNSAQETDQLRVQLHRLVEDVEPRPDALPRMLAAARRRRSPRRPLIALVGAAAVAAAAFVVTTVTMPGQEAPQPVSVQPDSYLAAPEPGVIASFDVLSGRENGEIARVAGADTAVLAADRDRVYTLTSKPDGRRIVEVALSGGQRELPGNVGEVRLLTAGGGRVAYLDGASVVVVNGQHVQRLAVPAGLRVDDLALADDGRLAVLAGQRNDRKDSVLLLAPEANSLAAHVEVEPGVPCGPVAISWTGPDVAALQPDGCGTAQSRVATFDTDTGRKMGAGVPFQAELVPGATRLSTDPLGRFLVSTDGRGQWLVDEGMSRRLPPSCTSEGVCEQGPAIFWS